MSLKNTHSERGHCMCVIIAQSCLQQLSHRPILYRTPQLIKQFSVSKTFYLKKWLEGSNIYRPHGHQIFKSSSGFKLVSEQMTRDRQVLFPHFMQATWEKHICQIQTNVQIMRIFNISSLGKVLKYLALANRFLF